MYFNRRTLKAVKTRCNYNDMDARIPIALYDVLAQYITDEGHKNSFMNLGAFGDTVFHSLGINFQHSVQFSITENFYGHECTNILADPDFLPEINEKFDLIFSTLTLEQVNDLKKLLSKIYDTLSEGGLFIGSLFTQDNLIELQETFKYHTLTPRNYLYHTPSITSLLELISNIPGSSIHTEKLKIQYPSCIELLYSIKRLGLSNFTAKRTRVLQKSILQSICSYYDQQYKYGQGVICTLGFYIIAIQRQKFSKV